MIIRRKHNSNFTIVPNQPINNSELSYDALGLLTYLLSRPDNWTVWVQQLRTRGGIGRDKARRLIKSLCQAGHIVRQKVRDPDTQVFVADEYIVYDEPVTENPSLAVDEPAPENPATGKPSPENTTHSKDLKVLRTESSKAPSIEAAKSETGSPSKPRNRINYTPEFESFWKSYPTNPNMPKANAFKEWQRLDPADQQVATASLQAYRKHLVKEDWLKPVYAERYLKQRRFEGYADSANDIDWAKCCKVAVQSGQWSRMFGPLPGQPGCKVPAELVTPELIATFQNGRAAA